MNIPTNLKLIASGNVPTTTTLLKGEMAFGKIPSSGGSMKLFVNDEDSVTEIRVDWNNTSGGVNSILNKPSIPTGANLSGQASTFGQLAANGSATTWARSDHYHALPALNWSNMPAPPSNDKEYKIRFNGTSWVMYKPFNTSTQTLLSLTEDTTDGVQRSYDYSNLTAGVYMIELIKTTSGNTISWAVYVRSSSDTSLIMPGSFQGYSPIGTFNETYRFPGASQVVYVPENGTLQIRIFPTFSGTVIPTTLQTVDGLPQTYKLRIRYAAEY